MNTCKQQSSQPTLPIQSAQHKPEGGSPVRIRMTVTPQQAEEWLSKNTHNRPQKPTLAIAYGIDMEQGRWKYNHAAIIFDRNGTLVDGQHRLNACILSGSSFDTDVVFGADPEIQSTIDIGAVRTSGDSAHLNGIKNANIACAIAYLVLIHRNHGIEKMNNPANKPTKTMVLAEVMSNPTIAESAAKATTWSRKVCSPRVLGFCHYVFSQQNKGRAELFFDEVVNGVNLSRTNPAYCLREKLNEQARGKARLPTTHLIFLFFKAWSYYRAGRPMKLLKLWRNGGDTPEAFPSI